MSTGVDQLIERGLERYGAGDVDGALMAWEQALGLDPEDVRAAAYVDYVRENYEMLHGTPKLPDVDVPFGLDAVAGDSDYEVEVSRAEAAKKIAVYVESIDEGWFLDAEPSTQGQAPLELLPEPAPAPARSPKQTPRSVVAVSFHKVSDELDFGPAGGAIETPPPPPPEPPPDLDAPPIRPSRLQLPLSAASEAQSDAEITLEMEADEPDDSSEQPAVAGATSGLDDEQTRDFVAGAWPPPPDADLDFSDQRSAVPTREIAAPRGFVRARPEGLAPTITAAVVPMVARGPKPPTEPPAAVVPDPAEDDLATRPGNAASDPLDALELGAPRLAAEALAEFGGTGTGTGRAGPNDRTRETPPVRVTIPEPSGESDLEPGDDERTTERAAAGVGMRFDTMSELTLERGANRFSPAPIDEAGEGGDASGRHPPLVIIEDPVMGAAPAQSRVPTDELYGTPIAQSRVPTDELSAGTARLKRQPQATTPLPAAIPATPGGPGHESLAARIEAEVEASALPDESRADRTRRRVTELIERAIAASTRADHPTAIVALDIALAEDPESAVAQKLLHRHQPQILDCYQRYVGNLGSTPALAMPMHELADQKLDIRAAFLLSRIDGTLTFEEILDVSGMQRPEAFRHLSILLLRGILEVR